ncbi:hypothetical protein [Evansella halocellulosilytica]|nr:hypothetical protein [Evansella halocellulosilytica]
MKATKGAIKLAQERAKHLESSASCLDGWTNRGKLEEEEAAA